jgi:hypothetical protein
VDTAVSRSHRRRYEAGDESALADELVMALLSTGEDRGRRLAYAARGRELGDGEDMCVLPRWALEAALAYVFAAGGLRAGFGNVPKRRRGRHARWGTRLQQALEDADVARLVDQARVHDRRRPRVRRLSMEAALAETAERLDRPVDTLRQALRRARKRA